MSVNTPAANSRYDREAQNIDQVITEFTEATVSLAHELNCNEKVVSEFVDSAKALGELVAETAHDSAEARQQANENSDGIEEVESELNDEKNRRSAEIEGCHNRISSEIEELDEGGGSACSQGRGANSSEDNPHGSSKETTALEQICSLPEETAEENLTANQQRARFVAKDISDYGRKVPAGIAIKSSEIRRVLCAAEEGKTHTQTVSRVIDFLDRFGGSEVNEKKTRSGETTVVFTEEIAGRITSCVIEERQRAVIETTI